MSAPTFNTVLVANRGEIAVRVLRSARNLGYRTAAVYAPADAEALHVGLADVAVALPANDDKSPYLDIEAIVAAAQTAGAGAVHPGYGFLAENAAFAEAVTAAGLVWVGPPPEAIRVMGSKRLAKQKMIAAGVPCVPGYDGDDQSVDRLVAEAQQVGLPLMIKASAGGGGRGLRKVRSQAEVEPQLKLAKAEAESAFGDGELILERAIEQARHVEVQVFGDTYGQVVHLFERDCSAQRRHQKIVEEAPSPAVTPEIRARMGEVAVAAAQAVGYVGAGTVEMLLEGEDFYFMEMNTRLQVEHPVTELITGVDLVALQLEVARGAPLPFAQDDLHIEGHAIEVRLYAEDPEAGFLPQIGTVDRWLPPGGEGVRVDHGLREGYRVTADFDPMLAKIMAHGKTREQARRRLVRALENTVLHGVSCNQAFLQRILEHPVFRDGEVRTRFVDETDWAAQRMDDHVAARAVVAAHLAQAGGDGFRSGGSPTHTIVGFAESEGPVELAVEPSGDGLIVRAGEVETTLTLLPPLVQGQVRFRLGGGVDERAVLTDTPSGAELTWRGVPYRFEHHNPATPPEGAGGASGEVIKAPMAGKVVDVRIESGAVTAGQVVLVLEAMKMQLELEAPRDGTLELLAATGDQVAAKQVLARVGESE